MDLSELPSPAQRHSAWVKEQRVEIKNNKIAEYQVNMLVTFVLDD